MTIERHRALLEMVRLVLFEGVVVGALHTIGARPQVRIDWGNLGRWLTSTPIDQVVMSVVWLAALVLGWWALGSTLLYMAMRIGGLGACASVVERLTPPMVRGAVDRALAVSLVSSALLSAASPAIAGEQPPRSIAQHEVASATSDFERQPAGTHSESGEPSAPVPLGPQRQAPEPVQPPPSVAEQPTTQAPDSDEQPSKARTQPGGGSVAVGAGEVGADRESDRDAAGGSGAAAEANDGDESDDADRSRGAAEAQVDHEADEDAVRRPATPRPGRRYTVRVGDHLWKIAAEVVSREGEADRTAVASYWADLVRAAMPQLRSGDPNLIYPGEEFTLPPLHGPTGDGR